MQCIGRSRLHWQTRACALSTGVGIPCRIVVVLSKLSFPGLCRTFHLQPLPCDSSFSFLKILLVTWPKIFHQEVVKVDERAII
jgi:hypothetical protein